MAVYTRSATSELEAGKVMAHEKSLTRARYAQSILRIASTAPQNEAKRLVAGIASEFAHLDTPADIIEAEVGAIEALKRLAARMDDEPGRRKQHWAIANVLLPRGNEQRRIVTSRFITVPGLLQANQLTPKTCGRRIQSRS